MNATITSIKETGTHKPLVAGSNPALKNKTLSKIQTYNSVEDGSTAF